MKLLFILLSTLIFSEIWHLRAESEGLDFYDLEKDFESGSFIGSDLYLHETERDVDVGRIIDIIANQKLQKSPYLRPNFGVSQSAHWTILPIVSENQRTLVLENNFGMVDQFRVYLYQAGQVQEVFAGGDQHSFGNRFLDSRTMNTEITFPAGESFLITLSSGDTCVQIPLRLWESKDFSNWVHWEFLIFGLLIGIHLVMIAYNFILAIMMKDRLYLVYVVFVAGNLVFHLGNYNLIHYFAYSLFGMDTISNHIQLLSVEVIMLSGMVFTWQFLDLKKQQSKFWRNGFAMIAAASFFNITIGNPYSAWLATLITLLSASICISMLILAGIVRLKQDYVPARHYLMGWVVYLLGSGTAVMINLGLLETNTYSYWGHFVGGALEVSLFSIALGARLNFIKKQNQNNIETLNQELTKLNTDLEARVEERTQEIKDILKHLHQGVFTINQKGVIVGEYSKYSEEILGEQTLTDHSLIELFEKHSNLNSEKISLMKTAIQSSIDEDSLSFETNRHCLPREVIFEGEADNQRILELEWDTVTFDNQTTKILVSIRDVTETRELNRQIFNQQKEIRIVSQVIEVSPERFLQFKKVARDILKDVGQIFSEEKLTKELSRKVYFSYHTLKGIARSLEFLDISNAIHNAESNLDAFFENQNDDIEKLSKEQFSEIHQLIEDYIQVNDDRLGRSIDPDVTMIPNSLIENVLLQSKGLQISAEFLNTLKNLQQFCFKTLEDIFYQHLSSIKSIADQLEKPLPKTRFKGPDIGFDSDACEALDQVLHHLIRNSLDHGIEKLTERAKKGKPARGQITAELVGGERHCLIKFYDDGHGLRLDKLRNKAQEENLEFEPSLECLDKLLFADGFSTADKTTDISGRGVGMSAVRSILQNLGGDIRLCSEQEFNDQTEFLKFHWEITIDHRHTYQINSPKNEASAA